MFTSRQEISLLGPRNCTALRHAGMLPEFQDHGGGEQD